MGLRQWLVQNHRQAASVWLISFKKHTGETYVSYDEIVDQLICFGWIDSLPRKLDADRSMVLISPRKDGSAWSAVNKRRVARMVEVGDMHAAGREKIEQAKQDGSWAFLDDVEALIQPPDLGDAFDQFPGSRKNFEAFPRSAKRGILEWIKLAKRPETRVKRIAETARLAADNIKANFPR